MNFRNVLRNIGIVLILEAVLMLPPLIVSIYYKGNDMKAFLLTMLILLFVSIPLIFIKTEGRKISAREGLSVVSFGWILMSFFGALPYYFSGSIPNFVDCFFESVSGLSTTGASILREIESLPKGILFWRSFTLWMGGLGILVMTLAMIPSAGAGTFQIMKAETPGPNLMKLVPKIGQTAKILYAMYFGMTMLLTMLLMAGNMSLYDALIHSFGTAGTGGFSNMNLSIRAFDSVYIETVIGIFMFIFGVNLALYYQALKGNPKALFKDEEFRFYALLTVGSIVLIALNLKSTVFDSLGMSFRHAFFQVTSIMSTTAYTTTDFNIWPDFSKAILLILMFVGSCAGSTAGGIKNLRILLLLKIVRREIMKIIHPRAVSSVKIGGKIVDDGILNNICVFFFLYVLIFSLGFLALTLDGHNFEIAISGMASAMGNVGTGFGNIGPMGNFSEFSSFSKIVLMIGMLIGRLEIYPIVMLVIPSFWKKVNI